MNEILIGFLIAMFTIFIVGTVVGWYKQYNSIKKINKNIGDIWKCTEDIYSNTGIEVSALNNSIEESNRNLYTNVDDIYRAIDEKIESIKSMIDSRINKLENKIEK